MTRNLIVAALGGNALAKRGAPMTAETQRGNVRRAASALAQLLEAGHLLVITHGNGPQVGMHALQSNAGPPDGLYPLDILNAESEGLIRYLIELELRNAVAPVGEVATLLTQVLVDRNDLAFRNLTNPIGPTYDDLRSREIAAQRGWAMARDGRGWWRVVPSPQPRGILGISVIARLVEAGVTVICAGGGGIPVACSGDGSLSGVEDVVDKDLASSLLARELEADHLLLLTDVPGVYLDWGKTQPQLIASAGPGMLDPAQFPSGSMGPKLEAANAFALATGKPASIGCLDDAASIVRGITGTTIDPTVGKLSLRR